MSAGLVFAQFGLLAALAWQVYAKWPAIALGNMAAGLFAMSIALGLWTLTVNRPGNFNVIPEPKAGACLVTKGPCQWIRHPMYSSLLLLAAGLAWVINGWWAWYTWLMLAIVLWFKSVIEERFLRDHFSAYTDYQTSTKRFIPFMF